MALPSAASVNITVVMLRLPRMLATNPFHADKAREIACPVAHASLAQVQVHCSKGAQTTAEVRIRSCRRHRCGLLIHRKRGRW